MKPAHTNRHDGHSTLLVMSSNSRVETANSRVETTSTALWRQQIQSCGDSKQSCEDSKHSPVETANSRAGETWGLKTDDRPEAKIGLILFPLYWKRRVCAYAGLVSE